jgi:hypothetical protein
MNNNQQAWNTASIVEQLKEAITKLVPDAYEGGDPGTEKEAIAPLLKLDPIAQTNAIKELAPEMKVSQAVIKQMLARLRSETAKGQGGIHAAAVPKWPEPPSVSQQPVDGYELLRDLIQAIQKFVHLEDGQPLVVALWVLFSWTFEKVAETSPFLRVLSPLRNCGKSTLLKALRHLTRAG